MFRKRLKLAKMLQHLVMICSDKDLKIGQNVTKLGSNKFSKLNKTLQRTMWALGKNWFFHLHKLSHADLILGGHSEHVLLSFAQSLGCVLCVVWGADAGEVKAEALTLLNNVAGDIGASIVCGNIPLEADLALSDRGDSQVPWWTRYIWRIMKFTLWKSQSNSKTH